MIDSQGVYFILHQYGSMLQDAILAKPPVIEYRNVRRVVICGMGGSGVIGDFVKALCGRVVIETVKGYYIPQWVGRDDLVICVSYSGNTEETLSCFAQATRRNCLIYAVSSGGKLLNAARDGGFAHTRIPAGLPPRFATVHMLVPVLAVLQELGISQAYSHLPGNVAVDEKFARHAASQLVGKTPIIYASTKNMVLAEKLKTDINENAKVPAFYNVFPESNHNELNSYEHITPNYVAVFLIDPHDDERIHRRMRAAKQLLSERDVTILDVPLSYKEPLYKLLHGNLLCLLIAYFLALEYGVDPGPVAIIERFKKDIARK